MVRVVRVIDCEYDVNLKPISVTCEDDGEEYEFIAVVHCKNCIHYKRVIGAVGGWCDCTYTDFETEPDDYCSFGMRDE